MTIKITNKGRVILDRDVLAVVGAYVVVSFDEATKQLKIQAASQSDPTSKSFLITAKGELMSGIYLLKAMGYKYETGTCLHRGNKTDSNTVVVDLYKQFFSKGEEEKR